MIAALGTLPFFATLWLLVVLGAAVLEESGAKIAAALKGEPAGQPSRSGTHVRMRIRASSRAATIPNVAWRAAA
jgi:hypothetical protein